ncbi:MAG: NADH-quinone oxidoreductase subunit J [Proteobacteria bacterium]|nr:MAG: NADH-quinone oxidoreductase subunit J [Pseudomonadota bacterium]
MLASSDVLFYILAFIAVFFGSGVVLARNPIFSAMSLVITMIGVAFLFGLLDAWFLAGVQLIVYAGAVTVLFVMVLMLFDLKHEGKTFSKGILGNGIKLVASGVTLGMLLTYVWSTYATEPTFKPTTVAATSSIKATKDLATILFTDYIFAFEAIGVLLLMIAVGAVTLSRITGGTHHADS